MFRKFKASFPPWQYDQERQQAMVESYIELFTMYPVNAVEKAMRDFRLGAVERDQRGVNFLPTPQEFGQHVRKWTGWVIAPPAHLATKQVQDALVYRRIEERKALAHG